jgi:hypothetical protein
MTLKSMNENTWQEAPDAVIVLVNKTKHNYILDLPSGRYRLDAGRRMRTLRAILEIDQVQKLVSDGQLAVEV